jgi:hypothetical protein
MQSHSRISVPATMHWSPVEVQPQCRQGPHSLHASLLGHTRDACLTPCRSTLRARAGSRLGRARSEERKVLHGDIQHSNSQGGSSSRRGRGRPGDCRRLVEGVHKRLLGVLLLPEVGPAAADGGWSSNKRERQGGGRGGSWAVLAGQA